MAKKFKNPWAKGGEQWNPDVLSSKAIDSRSSADLSNSSSSTFSEKKFSTNVATPIGEDACLDLLIQVTLQNLESIKLQYEGNVYSISLLDQIFGEISGFPSSQVPNPYSDCCGTVYGVGVYGLKSESMNDFIDENSPDFYQRSIVLDPAVLGNEKFGDNGYPIAYIVHVILKTDRPDRFIKINIGIYRNDICAF